VVAGAVGEAEGGARAGGLKEILGGEIGGDRLREDGGDGGGLGGFAGREGAAVERRFVEDEEEAPGGVALGEGARRVGALLGEKVAHRAQRRRILFGAAGGGDFGGGQERGGHGGGTPRFPRIMMTIICG
jgi:hypothetical protein